LAKMAPTKDVQPSEAERRLEGGKKGSVAGAAEAARVRTHRNTSEHRGGMIRKSRDNSMLRKAEVPDRDKQIQRSTYTEEEDQLCTN